jgi:hypothetical protein
MTDQPPPYSAPPAASGAPAPAAPPAFVAAPPTPVGPPMAPKTNTLAIISLVAAFFVSLAAIICGHIALSQIKKRGERGRGLAIAGLVLGYLGLVGGIILAIFAITFSLTTGTAVVTKAADCVKVEKAGSAMISSVTTAFSAASSSTENAQADIKAATDTFQSETANVKNAEVVAGVQNVDAKLEAMNKAFGDLVAAGDQGDPAALQSAATDVDTALTALTKTCTSITK